MKTQIVVNFLHWHLLCSKKLLYINYSKYSKPINLDILKKSFRCNIPKNYISSPIIHLDDIVYSHPSAYYLHSLGKFRLVNYFVYGTISNICQAISEHKYFKMLGCDMLLIFAQIFRTYIKK